MERRKAGAAEAAASLHAAEAALRGVKARPEPSDGPGRREGGVLRRGPSRGRGEAGGEALKTNTTLTKLYLYNNQFRPEGEHV